MKTVFLAVITAALALAQITTINASDTVANSRTTINNNFGQTVIGATNLTTAGAVPYVSASGTVNQDPTKLFWDSSNKRLGVGTGSPASTIDVQATKATAVVKSTDAGAANGPSLSITKGDSGQQASFMLFDGATQKWNVMAASASNDLQFWRGGQGTPSFTILSSNGNVGIGTSSPTGRLHVYSSGSDESLFQSTASQRLYVQRATNGDYGALIFKTTNASAPNWVVGYQNEAAGYFAIGGSPDSGTAPKLVITGTGNVGIGTTSPAVPLDVNGAIQGPKIRLTPEGGYAVLFTAAEALSQGEIVYFAQGGTADNVSKAPAGNEMPVGVVYASAAQGASVWVVTTGRVKVLPEAGITAAMGYVLYVGATAGRAGQSATAPANDHWKEVGHWAATGSGAGALTYALVHFN